MVDNPFQEPRYRYRSFSPAEAEQVTGVAQQTVRNWRRLGFLPTYRGINAKFFASDLLTIWTYGLMAERGIGPARTKPMLGSISRLLKAHAERQPAANPGKVDFLFEPDPEARYVVWFSSGIVGFGGSVDDVLAGRGNYTLREDGDQAEPSDLATTGALIVLDVEALAVEFIARTGALWVPNPAFVSEQNARPAELEGVIPPPLQGHDAMPSAVAGPIAAPTPPSSDNL